MKSLFEEKYGVDPRTLGTTEEINNFIRKKEKDEIRRRVDLASSDDIRAELWARKGVRKLGLATDEELEAELDKREAKKITFKRLKNWIASMI